MDHIKHGIDAVSACAVIASLSHMFPEILSGTAALLSIVWYGIRIYEWWRTKK